MTSVTVRAEGKKLHVSSPYNPDYVSVVKCLGGKWDAETRTWSVPARQAQALRDLLLRVYGTDGGIPAPVAKPGKAGAATAPAAPAAEVPAAAPAAPAAAPAAPPRTPREVLAAAAAAWPWVESLIVPMATTKT